MRKSFAKNHFRCSCCNEVVDSKLNPNSFVWDFAEPEIHRAYCAICEVCRIKIEKSGCNGINQYLEMLDKRYS